MWGQLVYAIIMIVVSEMIRSVTEKDVKPNQPTAGKLDVPTAQNGGTVRVIFGSEIIKDPNVVWYGDSATAPIYA